MFPEGCRKVAPRATRKVAPKYPGEFRNCATVAEELVRERMSGPMLTNSSTTNSAIASHFARLGRCWSSLVNFWATPAKSSRTWSNFGQHRAISVELGQVCANFGATWPTLAKIWPTPAGFWSKLGVNHSLSGYFAGCGASNCSVVFGRLCPLGRGRPLKSRPCRKGAAIGPGEARHRLKRAIAGPLCDLVLNK